MCCSSRDGLCWKSVAKSATFLSWDPGIKNKNSASSAKRIIWILLPVSLNQHQRLKWLRLFPHKLRKIKRKLRWIDLKKKSKECWSRGSRKKWSSTTTLNLSLRYYPSPRLRSLKKCKTSVATKWSRLFLRNRWTFAPDLKKNKIWEWSISILHQSAHAKT